VGSNLRKVNEEGKKGNSHCDSLLSFNKVDLPTRQGTNSVTPTEKNYMEHKWKRYTKASFNEFYVII